MLIPLSDIAILRRQRRELDPAKVQELADDIQSNGLLHPIVVRRPSPAERSEVGDKPYVLSVGGRRTAAHVLLGRDVIEANLKEDIRDPLHAKQIELSENLRRVDLSWQEEIDARAEMTELLIKQGGLVQKDGQHGPILKPLTPAEVAKEVGVSQAQLSKDLQLHAAMQKDPSLRTAETKGAAIRAVLHTQVIAERVRAVDSNKDLSVLRDKLHTADGVAFAKGLPSQSIDLVFCDLPYGIDYFEIRTDASEASKGHYDDDPEKVKHFIAKLVPECLRVVKPTGWIVFFMCYEWHAWVQDLISDTCRNHFRPRVYGGPGIHYDWDPDLKGTMCDAMKKPDETCDFAFSPELPPWIWNRSGPGNFGHFPDRHAANRYDLIIVVPGSSAARFTRKPIENVLSFPSVPIGPERLHEHQKPHELCCEIISRLTVVGEKVADFCFGSGAHLAAAASLGRDFVGCDDNPGNLASALTLVAKHYDRTRAEAIARATGRKG